MASTKRPGLCPSILMVLGASCASIACPTETTPPERSAATAQATTVLCCDSFEIGADVSGANFGMEGTLAEKFHVYAQAVADLAGLSNGTMHDITIACANIARDLGANELDLQSTSSVREVCALASARIDAYFGSDGEFSTAGSLTIDYQSPTCSASIDARAQVRLATALASLEANLPELLVAVEARGTRFVATAEDSLDAGIDIVRNPGALGVEGSACFLRIGAAGASAVGQLKASIEAAAMVTGSLDLG